MNVSAPFVRRPVATTLLGIGLVLAGTLALHLLPVAPLPRVDVPTIKVSAELSGASPETMASAVATPLERALGRIAGVTEMTSSSVTGATTITLLFDLHRNLDGAARDVQAALNEARAGLPSGMSASPRYREVSSADAPIMVLALTSGSLPPGRLYGAAATRLTQRLSQIPGVGEVELVGSSLPAVRVALDPAALNRFGIGFETVRAAIAAATPDHPTGAIAAGTRYWQIATNDRLHSPADFRRIIVAHHDGAAVPLGAVATVTDSVRDPYRAGLADGKPAVLAIIRRKPNANIIETVDAITANLPALRASLPAAMDLHVIVDRTATVRASLRDAEHALAIAVVLVVLVMLAFLRDVRAALIASIAAPISLIGTLAVMYLLDYSLDNLSLMALTIAVGFAVDDAVVVVENIARHLEAGEPPREAARAGAGEVGLTVLSMSMVLIAVFIPLLFMGGYVGLFVREFAVTLAIVISISLLVALTIVPMLCAWLLRRPEPARRHASLYTWIGNGLAWLADAYARSLGWVLAHQRVTLLVLLGVIGLNVYLYVVVPKGFFPRQDTGELTGSFAVGGSGSFVVTRYQLARFVAAVRADPAVASVAGYADRNSGSLFATLKPLADRSASADEIAARLRARLAGVPGASFTVKSVQDIRVGGRRSRSSYQYTIEADTAAALRAWAPRIHAAMAALPELRDVHSDAAGNGLETVLHVDRDAAARHGVSYRQIDSVLHDAFAQRPVATIYAPLNQYRVVMNVAPAFGGSPDAFDAIQVGSAGGRLVPLAVLAHHHQRPAPLGVDHLGQFVASTISFNLAPGVSLSAATRAIGRAVARLAVPTSVRGSFQGSARAFRQVLDEEPVLIVAALLTLFIVLGVLYESYVHPLTILSTLPSAGVGALLALLVLHTEFSVIALIGIFALIGIVMKNAIMMIDFALVAQRASGVGPREAIHRACLLRFRPILMTSLAVMLAAIPLALLHGNGAEMRRPLGIAIGGGLVMSQLLTLYTTPVVYLYLDRFSAWAGRRLRRSRDHRGMGLPRAEGDASP